MNMYLLCLFKQCLHQAGIDNILQARSGGKHVLNNGEEGVITFCEHSTHRACFFASMHINRAIKYH